MNCMFSNTFVFLTRILEHIRHDNEKIMLLKANYRAGDPLNIKFSGPLNYTVEKKRLVHSVCFSKTMAIQILRLNKICNKGKIIVFINLYEIRYSCQI